MYLIDNQLIVNLLNSNCQPRCRLCQLIVNLAKYYCQLINSVPVERAGNLSAHPPGAQVKPRSLSTLSLRQAKKKPRGAGLFFGLAVDAVLR